MLKRRSLKHEYLLICYLKIPKTGGLLNEHVEEIYKTTVDHFLRKQTKRCA